MHACMLVVQVPHCRANTHPFPSITPCSRRTVASILNQPSVLRGRQGHMVARSSTRRPFPGPAHSPHTAGAQWRASARTFACCAGDRGTRTWPYAVASRHTPSRITSPPLPLYSRALSMAGTRFITWGGRARGGASVVQGWCKGSHALSMAGTVFVHHLGEGQGRFKNTCM